MDTTTGPVWVLWHGGANYSRGHEADIERFDTVESAAIEAENRLRSGNHFPCDFLYVNKPHHRVMTPCVDESSTMEIYLADPTGDSLIPDAVLEWCEAAQEFVIAEDGDYVTRGPRN